MQVVTRLERLKNLTGIRIQVNCGDFLEQKDGTYKIHECQKLVWYIEKRGSARL